jgi:hypothetical protein
MVFGQGLKDGEAFVARAGEDLARSGAVWAADGRPVEVLNGGGPGWGIWQAVIAARRSVDQFAPAAGVVLLSPIAVYWPPFKSEAEKQAYMASYRRKILVRKTSRFATYVYRRLQRANVNSGQRGLPTEDYYADHEKLWAPDEALLRELAAACAGRTTLVLGVLDDFSPLVADQSRKGHDWMAEKVRALAESLGLPFIDLGPAFDGQRTEDVTFSQGDPHYNVFGSRLAGARLAAELRAQKLVTAPTPDAIRTGSR